MSKQSNGGLSITISVTQTPSRKAIKAKIQVSKGKQRALRAKVESQIQQAKRQIKEIEKNGLKETPALNELNKRGTTLTTKGKNYNQLQSTYFSLARFLKAQTSTAQGAIRVLEQTARTIGAENTTPQGLKDLAEEFFEIASKTDELLKTGEHKYSAGSTRIFEAIRRIQRENNALWKSAGSTAEKAHAVVEKLEDEIIKTKQYETMDYASKKIQEALATSFKGAITTTFKKGFNFN